MTATDPLTGEVVDLEQVGAEIVALEAAYGESQAESTRLAELLSNAKAIIRRTTPPLSPAIDAGRGWKIVVEPGRRGNRTIDQAIASEHREVLMDLGLGEETRVFRPCSLKQVVSNRAVLVARGVPYNQLVREPSEGPAIVTTVKEGI